MIKVNQPDQNSISLNKPWVKLSEVQDLIENNIGLSDEKIANIIINSFNKQAMFEIVVYAVKHIRVSVLARLKRQDPLHRKETRREKYAREKDVKATVDKWTFDIRRTCSSILNMTGSAVRALQFIPIENFANVGDDQKVSEVFKYGEVHKMILSTYRKH